MISFKELNSENAEKLCQSLSQGLSADGASCLCELVWGIDTDCEDMEYAVSVCASCLLVRIFDMGRYLFIYPCELDENADVRAAIEAIGEYAMREEIPLVFVDVPAHEISSFSGYRHMDIDADDSCCEVYRVRIKTECELIPEIPHVVGERVELCELSESDIPLYAELCKDENVNKCWGYNYSDDIEDPTDEYFFENANADFSRGVAVTMAVRAFDEFVGEATIYAFDGKGGAEFAVRLLPRWQGKGLGTETVLATVQAAGQMGLVRLYAKIMKENHGSIAMLRKVTDKVLEEADCFTFLIEL